MVAARLTEALFHYLEPTAVNAPRPPITRLQWTDQRVLNFLLDGFKPPLGALSATLESFHFTLKLGNPILGVSQLDGQPVCRGHPHTPAALAPSWAMEHTLAAIQSVA